MNVHYVMYPDIAAAKLIGVKICSYVFDLNPVFKKF